MSVGAASEERMGGMHDKLTGMLDAHLDSCIQENVLPEESTMRIIRGLLQDSKIVAQGFIAATEGRVAKVIAMKQKSKRFADSANGDKEGTNG